jgi:hypothetical protein
MANFKLLKRTPTKEKQPVGKATLIFDEEKMKTVSDSFMKRTREEGDKARAEAKKKEEEAKKKR